MMLIPAFAASAATPYQTHTYMATGKNALNSPDAYVPVISVDAAYMGATAFGDVSDLFVGPDNELYIVEGDSAGGTAKQARDRRFQAILPLRGKPLNAEKKRLNQVLANEEIRTIINALGAGIGETFNTENLKFHKVIILADADQDGAHIRAILLTFFFRYMKQLITDGHVFIGMPPLYKVYKKDKVEYVYSDLELPEAIERMGKGYQLQRYKGLGEMDNDQLWDTTMNPESRNLMQVTLEDVAEGEKLISTLMGDDVESRRAYIFEHANFNKVDTFEKQLGGKNGK